MYAILSGKITAFLITYHAVREEDREIYCYGLELLLSSIVNLIIVLSLGYLFNRFFQTVLFLVVFCPLRQFSGGIHAANHFKCSLYFIISILICFWLEKTWLINADNVVLLCMLTVSSLCIALLSPIEDRNKPLTNQERLSFKKRNFAVLIIWDLVISFDLLLFRFSINYLLYSIMAVMLLSVLLVVGYLKNKRGGVTYG